MTVSTVTNKSRQNGNDVTVAFPASIKIFAETDISVTILDSTTDALINTLVLNDGGALGFTVAFDTEAETLTVTTNTAPATGEDIQILRALPQTQTTDFPRATKFPAKANENGLDKSTMILQDQQEVLDRTAKLPVTSSVSSVVLPDPVARKALVWTAAADGTMENSTFDPDQAQADSAASAAAAAVSESNAATSETNAATSATNAATSETNAAQSATDAQAAVGAVKVSANDTTAGDLETKLLVGSGLALSTQNDGGNETRTIDTDVNGLTDVVVTASDEFMFGDVTDSNNRKKDTIQGILDLTPTSGWLAIETIIASSDTSIDFESGNIDNSSDEYQIHGTSVVFATNGSIPYALTSTDGGTIYDTGASDYSWGVKGISSDATDLDASAFNVAQIRLSGNTTMGNTVSSESFNFVMRLFDPSNASLQTQMEWSLVGSQDNNGRQIVLHGTGRRGASEDVDAVRIIPNTGGITSGTFTLYKKVNA